MKKYIRSASSYNNTNESQDSADIYFLHDTSYDEIFRQPQQLKNWIEEHLRDGDRHMTDSSLEECYRSVYIDTYPYYVELSAYQSTYPDPELVEHIRYYTDGTVEEWVDEPTI